MKNALRMRPERVIIGECRGPETLDMLQAMNTGHEGSMTTMHANTPRDAIARMETMITMAGFDLPLKAMRQQIASAVDLIIQANRLQGGAAQDHAHHGSGAAWSKTRSSCRTFTTTSRRASTRTAGRIGRFEATGMRPTLHGPLESAGVRLPASAFRQRVMLED